MVEETSNQRELLVSLTEEENDFSEMMINTASSILDKVTDGLLPLEIFQWMKHMIIRLIATEESYASDHITAWAGSAVVTVDGTMRDIACINVEWIE